MSAETEVRAASTQFYGALSRMANGDPGPVSAICSHGSTITTMHPIGGREVGWAQVEGPWGQVAHLASDGKIGLRDQLLRVVGDVAWEVGVEYGEFKLAGRPVSVEHRVTNIYQREGEGWKLVHHHTDASPAMQEVLKQLQVASEPSASRA